MTEYGDKHHKNKEKRFSGEEVLNRSESWRAIAKHVVSDEDEKIQSNIVFTGKVLQGGNFSGENLENANFSGSNMQEINLQNANLKNVDFTGADLSGADLSGANLDGAIFSGAKLIGTNFTGAHMHNVKLVDADLQDAILLDADLDNLSIAELQELVEYLAMYYPHKLNLTRLNLTLLDLKRIDLRKVNLRGVDFTGCSFFGVNIYELDLSECIISQAQIEQAIGHIPTPHELKQLLAPKRRNKKAKMKGIDFSSLFDDRGSFEWDATKGGIDVGGIVKFSKGHSEHKKDSDEKIIDGYNKKKEEKTENNNEELRKSIEEYKKEVLEIRREQKDNKSKDNMKEQMITQRSGNERY